MFIQVNGLRLFVDIEGPSLVAQGPILREKPTLVLLHGGPGADHSIYKPAFSTLNDLVQVIYYDHRGNGRSDDGDPALWTLDQWADDLHALINTLGLKRPIIYGASFGGFVAQAYATKYPNEPAAMIFASTTANVIFEHIYEAFARFAGTQAGDIARAYWSAPTAERRKAYIETCLPHYSRRPPDANMMARMILKNPVAMHFNGPNNEMGRFDYHAALAKITCPTLILSGDHDPIMPLSFSTDLHASLVNAETTHHTLDNAGHMLDHDQPERLFALLRDFISDQGGRP